MNLHKYTIIVWLTLILEKFTSTIHVQNNMNEGEVQARVVEVLKKRYPTLKCTADYNTITNEGKIWGPFLCLGFFELEGVD